MHYPIVVSRVSPRRRTFYQCVAVVLFIVGIGYALRTFVPAKKVNGVWVLQIGTLRYRLHIGPQEAPMATLAAAPVAAPTIRVITPANTREQFALDMLSQLGNRAPTNATISMVVQWTLMEDRGTDASSRNNYLNTTICGHNFVGAINKDGACGVGHYATYADGISATVDTLHQSNFSSIAEALVANDPEQAKQRLWASGWAESHYNDGVGWDGYQVSAPNVSTPISLEGDCGQNVQLAMDANGGALKHVVLTPGATFSFNQTMGNPETATYRTCAGVPGGNWCNFAARYAQVARRLGLTLTFLHHGVDLGAGIENDVLIWNVGGVAGFEDGRQDLLITNTSARTVVFETQTVDGGVEVVGS